ncbi:MAG: twin-arginine translocation signal domain-containing protein [Pyrinomonadaceae bacterium]
MKTEKNETKPNDEIEDQANTPMSRRNLLKTTIAASAAVSLGLLGATETPVQAQTGARDRDDLALNEYFRNDFNYCDAKILAGLWGGNVVEAKIRMGYTLLNNKPDQAQRSIREARGLAMENARVYSGQGYGGLNFPINYQDGGYQYSDAEALSRYWSQDVGETKLVMETMLISGKDKEIRAALDKARR